MPSIASWLENPRTPCPTGDVALQEGSKIFGNGRNLPAAETDLRKVEGNDRIDESAHGKLPISAGGQRIRRNDRNSMSSLDESDLCIEIVDRKIGLILDASFGEVTVYKLL
jgi:hypothetical protein